MTRAPGTLAFFFHRILLGTLFLASVSCQDEVINRPVFQSTSISAVNTNSALFEGNFEVLGSGDWTDYGFVWGPTDNPTLDQSTFSFGKKPMVGNFSATASEFWDLNKTYYVRAFIRSNDIVIYANTIHFVSPATAPLVVTDFSPKSGSTGTLITIVGMSLNQGNFDQVYLTIQDYVCHPVSVSLTQIVVAVPEVNTAGQFTPVLHDGTSSIPLPGIFTLLGPSITSVSPVSGIPGSTVTVTGNGFSSTAANNQTNFTKDFTTFPAQVIAATPTQLTLVVPTVYTSGPYALTISVDGISAPSSPQFSIIGAQITSFSPMTGYPGQIITVSGENFSNVPAHNILTFNDLTANVLTATTNQLTISFPFNLSADTYITPGHFDLTVQEIGLNMESVDIFTPLTPWSRKNDFGGVSRSDATGFVINNYAYVGLGGGYSDFWKYDSSNDTWSRISDFPPGGNRYGQFSFSLNGKGYVGGGTTYDIANGTDKLLKDLWEYDPATDAWTQKNDFISTSTDLNLLASGMSINNKGYIIEGSVVYQYDANLDQWSIQPNPFPGTTGSGNVALSGNGFGYVGLGLANGIPISQFWQYDPVHDQWKQLANYPGVSTWYNSSFVVNGNPYVGYGPGADSEFYKFDTAANSWTRVPNGPGSSGTGFILGAVGFGINGAGYFTTGGGIKTYKFDPNF